jgi:hypothetical protein
MQRSTDCFSEAKWNEVKERNLMAISFRVASLKEAHILCM